VEEKLERDARKFYRNPEWRRRWIVIPLIWILGVIYFSAAAVYMYNWVGDKIFDRQKNLKFLRITAVKGRMLYDIKHFEVVGGQPVKLEFVNPDVMAHNLVIVKPNAIEAVGLAADRMLADPEEVEIGQYIPKSDAVLFHTKMILPNSTETLRFNAPKDSGAYPYLCTFPGHWRTMKGTMTVK
tara:strand:+ start:423 stop:971 length:549 start_codon:yes stop_codon:yes gene_type:complete